MNRDREMEDEYLVLRVRLREYSTETMARIDTVMDGIERILEGKSGAILVTTDFRPTR